MENGDAIPQRASAIEDDIKELRKPNCQHRFTTSHNIPKLSENVDAIPYRLLVLENNAKELQKPHYQQRSATTSIPSDGQIIEASGTSLSKIMEFNTSKMRNVQLSNSNYPTYLPNPLFELNNFIEARSVQNRLLTCRTSKNNLQNISCFHHEQQITSNDIRQPDNFERNYLFSKRLPDNVTLNIQQIENAPTSNVAYNNVYAIEQHENHSYLFHNNEQQQVCSNNIRQPELSTNSSISKGHSDNIALNFQEVINHDFLLHNNEQQQICSNTRQSQVSTNFDRNPFYTGTFSENIGNIQENENESNRSYVYNVMYSTEQHENNHLHEEETRVDNIALDYLQTVIDCLSENPGEFDAIAKHFPKIFEGMENNNFVLSIAMENIFEESIKKPNFRYMGAKLYHLLHMLNPNEGSHFLTLLKYKLDYQREELKNLLKKKQYGDVRETTLFLAELYVQIRNEHFRVRLIADNLFYLLNQLILNKEPDNIRCVCMALKLSGYDLNTHCADEIKDIFKKLYEINILYPNKYPLLDCVISLHKNNWGRSTSTLDSPKRDIADILHSDRDIDLPIFYGPDGCEITDEECQFLIDNTDSIVGFIDGEELDNDSDIYVDPEMDEESKNDFKEFIKHNYRSS